MPDHQLGVPRDVPEQAPFEVIDRIEDSLAAVPTVAQEAAQETAREEAQVEARAEVRRNWRWTNIAAAAVAIAVSFATSSITYYTSQAAAEQAQTDADRAVQLGQSAKKTVDDALTELGAANQQLQERGQAPVQVAPNPDPSDAIQAAVLAKVLAQLPAPPATPTAEQVADQLRPAVVNAVTDRTRLAALIADYFSANAPPGPSQEAIQAAVDRAYAANPPRDGRDGDKGDPGLNGESPPCLSEPNQCRGEDSTVPGPPGPPPNSWTWPDPVVPAVTHTCTRSGGPDDAADYSCT